MNVELYENLVRAFYNNATRIPMQGFTTKFYDDAFSTFFMGQSFTVTRNTIDEALHLDDEDEVETDSWHFDTLSLARVVFNDVSLSSSLTQDAKFIMNDRLLHLIVTHVLAFLELIILSLGNIITGGCL